MSTPLTDAINALTTYSNTVTGASDTTLSDAVATLAAGYGGGGSAPYGFVSETVITAETGVTTGTNNNRTVLESFESGLTDTTDFNLYIFFFDGNTINTKGGRFGLWQRTSSTTTTCVTCRRNGTALQWTAQSQDFYYSAGTKVHILKFNSSITF